MELQYWLVGLTPETYHAAQARVWEELRSYPRAITHLKRYLENSEDANIRWWLAHCHGWVGNWTEAALEYAKIVPLLPKPEVRLGQAEAEFHAGNHAKALELLDGIDRDFPTLEASLENVRVRLRRAHESLSGSRTVESPTGRFQISVSMREVFNSHWVESPTLLEKSTGTMLLTFGDRNWSLDEARWLDDSTVALTLRKYPGNHTPADVVVTVDCAGRSAKIGETELKARNEVEPALERALTWRYG